MLDAQGEGGDKEHDDERDEGAKVEGRQRQRQFEEPDTEDLATLQHGRSVAVMAYDDTSDDDEEPVGAASTGEGEGEDEMLVDAKRELMNEHLVDFGHSVFKMADELAVELWLECELPLSAPRMLYVPLFEELAKHVCVKATDGITSAIALPPAKGEKLPVVQTAGVNFAVLAELADLPSVTSNHIHAVLGFYGVEAARVTIVNEIVTATRAT